VLKKKYKIIGPREDSEIVNFVIYTPGPRIQTKGNSGNTEDTFRLPYYNYISFVRKNKLNKIVLAWVSLFLLFRGMLMAIYIYVFHAVRLQFLVSNIFKIVSITVMIQLNGDRAGGSGVIFTCWAQIQELSNLSPLFRNLI